MNRFLTLLVFLGSLVQNGAARGGMVPDFRTGGETRDATVGVDVLMSLWIEPSQVLANPAERADVYVSVTRDGLSVPDQQVRFIRYSWSEALSDGTIYGPTDDRPPGSYLPFPSGGFPYPGGGISNLITTTTNSEGIAHVEFIPPEWDDYIEDDPYHRIVVWYNVDGGGNQYTSVDFLMVPEPATLSMLFLGGVLGLRRRP